MEQFAADYLINLAAELSGALIPHLTSRLKQALSGDEAQQAMQRAIEAGLIGLLTAATDAEPHERDHLDTIFRHFSANPRWHAS